MGRRTVRTRDRPGSPEIGHVIRTQPERDPRRRLRAQVRDSLFFANCSSAALSPECFSEAKEEQIESRAWLQQRIHWELPGERRGGAFSSPQSVLCSGLNTLTFLAINSRSPDLGRKERGRGERRGTERTGVWVGGYSAHLQHTANAPGRAAFLAVHVRPAILLQPGDPALEKDQPAGATNMRGTSGRRASPAHRAHRRHRRPAAEARRRRRLCPRGPPGNPGRILGLRRPARPARRRRAPRARTEERDRRLVKSRLECLVLLYGTVDK